jgi:hypothetical protein
MRLTDYIMTQPHRAFSEFNALGAYAFTRHKDKFNWINTTTEPMPDTCAIQRWSGDAFDDGIKAKCEEILNGVCGMRQLPCHLKPEWPRTKFNCGIMADYPLIEMQAMVVTHNWMRFRSDTKDDSKDSRKMIYLSRDASRHGPSTRCIGRQTRRRLATGTKGQEAEETQGRA